MIGRLTGVILLKQWPELLLDVHGVGYEVSVSMHTLEQLPDVGVTVSLHTHFVVREDAQLLYGFHTLKERALFRQLIKVSGVGTKTALTMLSSMRPDQFLRCLEEKDTASLMKLPGIGKKTAQRLLLDMADRLHDVYAAHPMVGTKDAADHQEGSAEVQDAIRALVSLGYKPQQAGRMVRHVQKEEKQATADLIRDALHNMVDVI